MENSHSTGKAWKGKRVIKIKFKRINWIKTSPENDTLEGNLKAILEIFLGKELMLEERFGDIFNDALELATLLEQAVDLDQGNLKIKNSIKINPRF